MIGIVNYGVGNMGSLTSALRNIDRRYRIVDTPDDTAELDLLLLPGVGNAGHVMTHLNETGMAQWLRTSTLPVYGICVGMQILYESSPESNQPLLGVIPGELQSFSGVSQPAIHMGWNSVAEMGDFYFVHSYYAPTGPDTINCEYDVRFAALIASGMYHGVQFHPEKSGRNGLKFLSNWLPAERTSSK